MKGTENRAGWPTEIGRVLDNHQSDIFRASMIMEMRAMTDAEDRMQKAEQQRNKAEMIAM